MNKVSIVEMKAKLSEYLDRVADGETIVICRHNKPVAELRPIAAVRREPRPIGPLAGRPAFDIAASFFEPMDESDADGWEATMPATPTSTSGRRVSAVAEGKGPYGKNLTGHGTRRRS